MATRRNRYLYQQKILSLKTYFKFMSLLCWKKSVTFLRRNSRDDKNLALHDESWLLRNLCSWQNYESFVGNKSCGMEKNFTKWSFSKIWSLRPTEYIVVIFIFWVDVCLQFAWWKATMKSIGTLTQNIQWILWLDNSNIMMEYEESLATKALSKGWFIPPERAVPLAPRGGFV